MTVQTAMLDGFAPLARERLPDDTAELARFLCRRRVCKPIGVLTAREHKRHLGQAKTMMYVIRYKR